MTPSIWTAFYVEKPLPEAIRALADIGWRAFEASTEHLVEIETSATPDACIESVLAALAERECIMPQGHGYLQACVAHPDEARRVGDIERLAAHIRISGKLGIRDVVIHPGVYANCMETAESWAQLMAHNVEAFRRLGDLAGECGVRICLENTLGPGFRTPQELFDLLDAIDHPAMGICLDTSHANVARLDMVEAIRALSSVHLVTHISDNDHSGDQHRTPFYGSIDWRATVAALREIGYDGLFNLEIPGERHREAGIASFRARYAYEVAAWLVG